jgi:hypothetical protein
VFVGDEVLLAVSFAAARSGLADLTQRGLLLSRSQDAYGDGISSTTRVGPLGLSKIVRVQAAELAEASGSVGLAIRWEATGPGSALFPVLDADIRLTPAGDKVTLLTLSGAYRPPLGALGEALDRAILRKLTAATVRNFINRLAADITGHSSPAEATITGTETPLPGAPGPA